MFDVYVKNTVASRLPLLIEAVTANPSSLLVVTAPKQQHNAFLLKYSKKSETPNSGYDVQTCRNFARKSVTQLKLITDLGVLICLSDNLISVHDASSAQLSFQPISTLQKTKGATVFAVETVTNGVEACNDSADESISSPSCSYTYLCVSVKRKLQLYCWQNREFQEVPLLSDISFSDSVRAMIWCNSHLAVAVRDEYFLVSVFGDETGAGRGTVKFVFTVGNKPPLIVPLREHDVFGFCRDDSTILVNSDGGVATKKGFTEIRWSDAPAAVEYDKPFLVGMLRDSVEVRSLRPNQLLQTVQFPAVKFFSLGSSRSIFVVCQPAANQTDLHNLYSDAARVKSNIQFLMGEKQYELAVQLAENVEDTPTSSNGEKTKFVHDIKRLYAYHLFGLRRFGESFEMYKSIDTEVIYVIGLFPDLVPNEVRRNMGYPGPVLESANDLPKNDLMTGLQALTAYLSEVRTNIAMDLHLQDQARAQLSKRQKPFDDFEPKSLTAISPVPMSDVALKSEDELVRMKSLLQIVDTTLLKCYLQTNDMLVASLLRLPDNSCDVVESESALTKKGKFSELLLLYERKQMHREALELLKTQATREGSPLKGLDRTIHYLQNLGRDHLALIFEYATWVLKANPDEGLKIFTEDCNEVKGLDRVAVKEFLSKTSPQSVIPYLDHVVHQWSDTTGTLHDALVEAYVRRVNTLLSENIRRLGDNTSIPAAGCEPGELGRLRTALLSFLQSSDRYNPSLVPLPRDAMYEERALVMGRLKEHKQAIAIYTNVLHDYKLAENYCRANYKKDTPANAEVYLLLLQMYAKPPEDMHLNLPKSQPNVSMALKVLHDYAAYIDSTKALELLPSNICLKDIWSAIEIALQSTASRIRELDIEKKLAYAQHLRVQQNLSSVEGVKWSINYDSTCKTCAKKIGDSAFARFSDGSLVHYYCYKGAAAASSSSESLPNINRP